jgi:membrane-bound metal-dependent hydrolase YbcI (DUF457 family)
MDTITHGIAGALIAKAVCGGEDIFSSRAMSKQRIVTWSLMLGAIFPDSDVLREVFSNNELLIITWHRSVTHSLLCLPVWVLLLAALTRQFARWRKWDAPSFAALTGIFAIGILSHIFLDLVTAFGTMIWSPLQWSRPAWDLIFIIDFTFTALLLLPQLLSWVYEDPQHGRRRALTMWLIFAPAPLLIARIGSIVGAPISTDSILAAMVLFTALFLLPALRGWGHTIKYSAWNRAGLLASACYLVAALFAHHTALDRVQKFSSLEHLEVESIGALPLPPSLWHWDGLVRAPRGVYEVRMDLSKPAATSASGFSNAGDSTPLQYSYYPDAFPNSYIDTARRLPEVQKVLWFSRFPVTRFHKEGKDPIVEISDLRFRKARSDRPASFTYQVRFNADGSVVSQGWLRE